MLLANLISSWILLLLSFHVISVDSVSIFSRSELFSQFTQGRLFWLLRVLAWAKEKLFMPEGIEFLEYKMATELEILGEMVDNKGIVRELISEE